MATNKKGSTKKGPFEYLVRVMAGRVVINGANDGGIYAKGGQLVSFSCAPHVKGFTFEAWALRRNDSKRQPVPKWPFKGPQPTWPQAAFSGQLRSPGRSKKPLYYKYSISVTGAVAADPIIIIEN